MATLLDSQSTYFLGSEDTKDLFILRLGKDRGFLTIQKNDKYSFKLAITNTTKKYQREEKQQL